MLSTLGLGMLTYTLIASPGYYVERHNIPAVVMFGGLWLLVLPAIILRFTAVRLFDAVATMAGHEHSRWRISLFWPSFA